MLHIRKSSACVIIKKIIPRKALQLHLQAMLRPAFIASHPPGFRKPKHREAHFQSEAFIQTRQWLFEGEQDCFYCLRVGSLQPSEQGGGMPAASDTELENTNRTKFEEELDKGAGNCKKKRRSQVPRKPMPAL